MLFIMDQVEVKDYKFIAEGFVNNVDAASTPLALVRRQRAAWKVEVHWKDPTIDRSFRRNIAEQVPRLAVLTR